MKKNKDKKRSLDLKSKLRPVSEETLRLYGGGRQNYGYSCCEYGGWFLLGYGCVGTGCPPGENPNHL